MSAVSGAFVKVLNCSFAGSEFVFGDLGKYQGHFGFVFAFQALPMIIFVASLMSILYYLRIIPALVLMAGKSDDETAADERGGVAGSGRQHSDGSNGSAAGDPALPGGPDGIRIDDDHDRGHGAHRRFGVRRVRAVRSGGAPPADGGGDDRARNHCASQNAGSGNRPAQDLRATSKLIEEDKPINLLDASVARRYRTACTWR